MTLREEAEREGVSITTIWARRHPERMAELRRRYDRSPRGRRRHRRYNATRSGQIRHLRQIRPEHHVAFRARAPSSLGQTLKP